MLKDNFDRISSQPIKIEKNLDKLGKQKWSIKN